jgi:hypothetical protein
MHKKRIIKQDMAECSVCGKELDEFETDVCSSCLPILRMLHPKIKCLEEQIKCHKKNAKKLKR